MAYQGNGTNAYGVSHAVIPLSSYKKLDIAFWLKPIAYAGTPQHIMEHRNDPAVPGLWALNYENLAFSTSESGVDVFDGTGAGRDCYILWPSKPATGGWHHMYYSITQTVGTEFEGGVIQHNVDNSNITTTADHSQNLAISGSFVDGLLWILQAVTSGGPTAGYYVNAAIEQLAIWGSASTTAATILNSSDQTAVFNGTPQSASIAPNFYWTFNADGTATLGGVNIDFTNGSFVAGHAPASSIFRNRYASRGRSGGRVIAHL